MVRAPLASVLLAITLSACGGWDGGAPTGPTPSPAVPSLKGDGTPTPVATPSVEPAANISLPDGFSAYVIATGFFRPTSIALTDDGNIYISERHGGVQRIIDANNDGVFESAMTFAEAPGEITGILAAPGGGLYVSSTGALILARDNNGDGVADSSEEIVLGLPHGRHQNNGLVVGDHDKIYLTNGSTCDDCDEADGRAATILQINADGSGSRVFASGLRNPYDLAFDGDGRLWATDNGSDEPCATIDELNFIVEGGDYGWPYGKDGCDPFSDGISPAASLGFHTAATGIDYYDSAQFPTEYRDHLFITLWGSYFTPPELDPQLLIASIEDATGPPNATIETFAEGFQHPIDVVVDRNGTLLVLDYGQGGVDDSSGTLYRIAYTE